MMSEARKYTMKIPATYINDSSSNNSNSSSNSNSSNNNDSEIINVMSSRFKEFCDSR